MEGGGPRAAGNISRPAGSTGFHAVAERGGRVSLGDKRIELAQRGFTTVGPRRRGILSGQAPCSILGESAAGDLVVKSPVAIPVSLRPREVGADFLVRSWCARLCHQVWLDTDWTAKRKPRTKKIRRDRASRV